MTRNSDKSAVELDLVIDLPCKPNIYVSWSTSKIRMRLVPSNMVKHSSNFLTDRSKALLLLWNLFVIFSSCLSLSYCLFCSLLLYGHLMGKMAALLALFYVMLSSVLSHFHICLESGVALDCIDS